MKFRASTVELAWKSLWALLSRHRATCQRQQATQERGDCFRTASPSSCRPPASPVRARPPRVTRRRWTRRGAAAAPRAPAAASSAARGSVGRRARAARCATRTGAVAGGQAGAFLVSLRVEVSEARGSSGRGDGRGRAASGKARGARKSSARRHGVPLTFRVSARPRPERGPRHIGPLQADLFAFWEPSFRNEFPQWLLWP